MQTFIAILATLSVFGLVMYDHRRLLDVVLAADPGSPWLVAAVCIVSVAILICTRHMVDQVLPIVLRQMRKRR